MEDAVIYAYQPLKGLAVNAPPVLYSTRMAEHVQTVRLKTFDFISV